MHSHDPSLEQIIDQHHAHVVALLEEIRELLQRLLGTREGES